VNARSFLIIIVAVVLFIAATGGIPGK